jgi:hypothetical protein
MMAARVAWFVRHEGFAGGWLGGKVSVLTGGRSRKPGIWDMLRGNVMCGKTFAAKTGISLDDLPYNQPRLAKVSIEWLGEPGELPK